jgi:hypothetical protein
VQVLEGNWDISRERAVGLNAASCYMQWTASEETAAMAALSRDGKTTS